jgi:2,3-bisphosphoglycerate-independent phosphoglycerate mutase
MNLSDRITSNDPFKAGQAVKEITGLDREGMISAKIVQDFVKKSHDLIEYHPINSQRMERRMPIANYILVREAGNVPARLSPIFTKKYKVKKPVCIAEPGVAKAAAMLAGMECITVQEMPFADTLDMIFENMDLSLEDHDFVFVHIKGPIDEAAHDGDFDAKKSGIEMIDERLERFRKFRGTLVLTCDHITSTESRRHMPGKVPVLVYGRGKDASKTFDEASARKGSLRSLTPSKLLSYATKAARRN